VVERLREWCKQHGITVYPDNRIREEAAAAVLDLKTKTLQNKRYSGTLCINHSKRNGRAYYALEDIAAHIIESFCPDLPSQY
jgi:hypothetical protein